MLSILIPVYNYNVLPLANALHKQCLDAKIDFEILCQDDASKSIYNLENEKINQLENCRFVENISNLGRGKNINSLAIKAKFDALLIMDCDTFPTENSFINNYYLEIKKNENLVFGGIKYEKNKPKKEQLLRWVYGNSRESISANKRKLNPNLSALTSNILIKKQLFLDNKFDEKIINYGYEDLLFLINLKRKNHIVNHIENPTFHLGIENSLQYITKTKIALVNLKLISKNHPIVINESKILKAYSFLKIFFLTKIISKTFSICEPLLIKNLTSNNPSLFLFDLYRMGYYCTLK